jgi:hypothetical protein
VRATAVAALFAEHTTVVARLDRAIQYLSAFEFHVR